MPKYAYKVVRYFDKTCFSAWQMGRNNVTYAIGKWTRPNKGCRQFLFVFDTRANAKAFEKKIFVYAKIFKAEVKNPTTQRRGITFNGKRFIPTEWLKGTLFVDAVKLLPPSKRAK